MPRDLATRYARATYEAVGALLDGCPFLTGVEIQLIAIAAEKAVDGALPKEPEVIETTAEVLQNW